MSLKFKIVFYNFMIFLIIFDVIYLFVWLLTIEMNPVKAIIVVGITFLLMPWAKANHFHSGRKVIIHSYAIDLYRKYHKQ